MGISETDANPSDQNVERSIRKQSNFLDKRKNSLIPEFLENDGLNPKEEVSMDMSRKDAQHIRNDEDNYSDLSSDKEADSTEGEITDDEVVSESPP